MFRVLVADDEPIERLVVTKKIQANFADRLEVVTAENGNDAVERFAREHCHIAILDINMPGMDGLTAAERIRESDGGCSIIFLTAYDEFSFAKKAFSVRALDYLLKPGSDDELIAVLEEAISLAERAAAAEPADKNARAGNAGTGANTGIGMNAGTGANAGIGMNASTGANTGADTNAGPGTNAGTGTDALPAASGRAEFGDNVRLRAVVQTMSAYIRERYQEDISLQDAAAFMGYSDAYFCKIFKQCFDKNFTTYLTEYRIAMAKDLLTDLETNIKDICVQVGFRDSNYFAKVFKRNTGMTPSEYRAGAVRRSAGL